MSFSNLDDCKTIQISGCTTNKAKIDIHGTRGLEGSVSAVEALEKEKMMLAIELLG